MFREHEKILKFIAYIDKEAFGFINNFMNAINDLTKQLCHPQETNTTFIQNCYTNYKKFISNVDKFRNKFTTRKCLAPKFYYPKHAIEFAEIHGVTPGFMDEQSIESVHQEYKGLESQYKGCLGIQGFIFMMRKMMVLCTPKYGCISF